MPAALRWLMQLLPTNPICVRLVQGGSRRVRHLYIRSGYLAVLIIVLLALLLPTQAADLSYRDLAANGATAFEVVAYLQIAVICILAPWFMAGAIAQESNARTWEIMLTTPLSAMQLVLGQLFGRLFFVLALLFASLPLFSITQYFGGVPGRSVLASYAVAATAAMLVGAIAVTLAVNRLAGRRAVFAFYVTVITYLALTWTIDLAIQSTRGTRGVTVMTALNPFLAQRALLDPTGYPRPDLIELGQLDPLRRLWFGRAVLTWNLLAGGLSVLLILISSTTVRSIGSASGVPWYRRLFGLGARGSRQRPPRNVWNNPVAWREGAARNATLPKMLLRWAFIAAGALWGLAIVLYFHNGGLNRATDPAGLQTFRLLLLATTMTELIIITLMALNMSATAISREREDGTLDLLLTTPITPKEYLGGKLRGLISYLVPLLAVPLGTVALAGLYVLFDGFGRAGGVAVTVPVPGRGPGATMEVPVVLPEAAIIAPLVVLPFIAFAVMIGLQWSVKSKGTVSSLIATVGVVGVVTGIVGLCGWQAGQGVSLVGPVLSALTPINMLFAIGEPESAMSETVFSAGTSGLNSARVALMIGAVVAAAIYIGVVSGIRASMVKTFDMTVRKLAGTR